MSSIRLSNKIILIFAILSVLIMAVPSDAPYIKAKGRPLNIAHRGLSSVLP